MSFRPSTPYLYSMFIEPAEVRVISRSPWLQSDSKLAYVFVSSLIYWKVANEDTANQPQSLGDFRNENSLELVRLSNGSWKEVNELVVADNYEGRRRITVSGRLRRHEGLKWHPPFRDVRIEIIAKTPEQHEVWVSKIRARIVPWTLLHKEMKAVPVEGKRSEFPGVPPEQMEKLSIVDELTVRIAAAVGPSTTLAKLIASAERVAETAEILARLLKHVAGMGTIFQLVSLCTQGVSICAQARLGMKDIPVEFGQVMILLRFVLESLVLVMNPSQCVNETDIDFLFKELKEAVVLIETAEMQLMHGKFHQIMDAEGVKELERKIDRLRHMNIVREENPRICAVDREAYYVNEERKPLDEELQKFLDEHQKLHDEARRIWNNGLHYVRPLLSPFFAGRSRELETIQDIVENWGSAAITQYGGVGKTELLTAFADRAERKKLVPGGVFWVTVNGSEMDVTESLAGLAGKLRRREMGEEERRNPNLVVSWLKKGLDRRRGRWLLCLDNADDSQVSGILNEVCRIAEPLQENGWIVITSRQGRPQIWSGITSERKLVLGPLPVEDAMVALWRRVRKIKTYHVDDVELMHAIKKLEWDDAHEYQALRELCGDEGLFSLGGLPLALEQAGAYMARFQCSFQEYLNMFKTADRMEDMRKIMRNTEELKPMRESQRSILTTWKISLDKLSVRALAVLRAMAMLGDGGVREAILEEIVKGCADEHGSTNCTFQSIIEELIYGSSIIWCHEEDRQEWGLYDMHRLVRRFILSDMMRGLAVWDEVYSIALLALHKFLQSELEKVGNSFKELPHIFGDSHRELAAHAMALVNYYTLPPPGRDISHISEVEDIHRYCGELMRFTGKSKEEVEVWEHLLVILHHQEAANRRRRHNALALDILSQRNHGKELKNSIAGAYSFLGGALWRTGKLDDAVSTFEQSLEIKRALLRQGKPHPAIASFLNNLGTLYGRMGKLDKALEKHEKSLEMFQAMHVTRNPQPAIASSLFNLGTLYYRMGKLDEALEKQEKGLEMYLEIYGPNTPHTDIANSLYNLGILYEALGKLDEALEKQEKSLEMRRAIQRPNKPHPDIVTSLNSLGHLYQVLGKMDSALEMHKQCLEMSRAIVGNNKPHFNIARSLSHIGFVYLKQNNPDLAAKYLERSHEMLRILNASNSMHRPIKATPSYLAKANEDQGRRDEATTISGLSIDIEEANDNNRRVV